MREPPAWILFILVSFLSLRSARSQELRSEHLTVENGLSENTIWSMSLDSDGFLWVNTQAGLDRYDGYAFSRMLSAGTQAGGGTIDFAGPILESRNNDAFWIGTTSRGLYRFDRLTGGFAPLPALPHDSLDLNRPGNKNVRTLLEEDDGTLWIGTEHALNRYIPATGKVALFLPGTGTLDTRQPINCYALEAESDSVLWVGAENGLYAFNKHSEVFERVALAGRNTQVYAICKRKSGELWIGTHGRGALCIDRDGNVITHLLGNENVCSVHDDGLNLWFGTVSGKLLWYRNGGSVATRVNYTEPGDEVHQITGILRDPSGVVWLGTIGGGLYKLAPRRIRIVLYTHERAGRGVLPSQKAVWSLAESGRTILVGTGKGLAQLDRANNVYKDIPHGTIDAPVRAMLVDGHNLYVGMLLRGFARWDTRTRVWTMFAGDDAAGEKSNVYSLLRDHTGTVWLGTNGRQIERFDPVAGKQVSYEDGRWDKWVLSLCEDQRGRIWAGTWSSGISEFDRTLGTYRYYSVDRSPDTVSLSDRVTVVHESLREPDILWLGTLGAGLLRFDTEKKNFTAFTEKAGLASNAIYGILEDDFGNLWMSTNNGISRFDPRTHAFANFDVRDGLQGNEFNLGAALKALDGTLYFGGDNGINRVIPDVDVDPHPPRVFLTGIRVFGAPISFDRNGATGVELDYRRNQVTFEFLGLHFRDPARNTYAYTLEGYDSEWHTVGTQRTASYTHLDAGEYVFRVKAANSDGVWSEPVSIALHIVPPFWKAMWFIAGSTVLLLLGCYGWHVHNVRHAVAVERARKEEEGRIRSMLKEDVHDTFAGVVAKISAIAKDLSFHNGTANGNSPDLHKIAEYADSLLQGYTDIQWEYDPGKDSLFELLAQLKKYGDTLFQHSRLQFTLSGDISNTTTVILPMEWRKELLLLFYEGMNNIAKHAGGCTTVVLFAQHEAGHLEIGLHDNGDGFREGDCPRRNGLLHMRERAARLDGKLSVESGQGTVIRFSGKLPRGRV